MRHMIDDNANTADTWFGLLKYIRSFHILDVAEGLF